jgi:thymidine kinase
VGVDEAQFFDDGLPDVCSAMADRGIRVIVAGLDLDYEGRPFGPMPLLLALAEEVTKLHAVCVETGRAAHFSHRISGGDNQVELGAQDRYIPLARHAYVAAKEEENS